MYLPPCECIYWSHDNHNSMMYTYWYLSAFLQIVAVRSEVQSKDLQLQNAQQQVIQYMYFIYFWLHLARVTLRWPPFIQLHDKNQQIQGKEEEIQDKDQQIRDKDQRIRDKDQQIRDKDQQIREKNQELELAQQQVKDQLLYGKWNVWLVVSANENYGCIL